MERYSVVVTSTQSSQPLRLLIPYPPAARCASLIEEIADRTSRFGKSINLKDNTCTLLLGGPDGPVLDPNDYLSDVVRGEQIFATFSPKESGHQAPTVIKPNDDNKGKIPICIVTPSIAKSNKNAKSSPAPAFYLPPSATVGQLHEKALQYLRNVSAGDPRPNNGVVALDLHTEESPISPSCFSTTLEQVGFPELATKGALNIYTVPRPAQREDASQNTTRIGMNELYEVSDHWVPEIAQSERGMCMFLCSLRVFTRLLRGEKVEDAQKDRALYIFDLFSHFPPAVRTLYLLIQGRVPTKQACAALSQAVFSILEDIVPANLIQDKKGRVFEGARLLFGLVSEKVKHARFADPSKEILPYTSLFHTVQIQRSQNTHSRLMGSYLAEDQEPSTHLRGSVRARIASISGAETQVIIFSPPKDAYHHPHRLADLVMPEELGDLHHLASLCGRVGLSVFMPSNLASIAPPSLTFDKEGHLAVYTGKQGCAMPGSDIVMHLPYHGEDTPNIGLVEQQLAPIIRGYVEDGTNVFDVLGSSQARALEYPEELLIFAVDCSASMNTPTGFIQDEPGIDPEAGTDQVDTVFDQGTYDRVTLEATQKRLLEHETFVDIVGAVSEAPTHYRMAVARKMLTFLSNLVGDELKAKRSQVWTAACIDRVKELGAFAAGISRYETALVDRILLFAIRLPQKPWKWRIGDQVPGQKEFFNLPDEITDIPVDLRCPISYEILQDPVVAADGQTYSRNALSKWMQIRRSSPLTGLAFENTELRPNHDLAERANAWIQSDDILEPQADQARSRNKRPRISGSGLVTVTFTSRTDSFSRALPDSLSTHQLYRVAFRGMKGRHHRFQLFLDDDGDECLGPSADTISSLGIGEGTSIEIVTDTDTPVQSEDSQLCLIKVFGSHNTDTPLFCYWTRKNKENTLASIMGKYWRYMFSLSAQTEYEKREVWTDLKVYGDGHFSGERRDSHSLLGIYLTAHHASGTLKQESLVRTDDEDPYGDIDEDMDDEEFKPLVLKVSIERSRRRPRRLSRLQVLKQMFEALINRIIAYSYRTHIGLVTFDTDAKNSQSLTHIIENFRRSVENMRARGDTALWDGLRLAKDQIADYAKKYPLAKRRIICLSDGNDTKSTMQPPILYWQLRRENIVVDTICIGDDDNRDLKTLSYLLGSYCFKPEDLTTALAICEMEPVLSQTERPPIAMVDSQNNFSVQTNFYNAHRAARFTTVTRDIFPPRKEHLRLQDDFIELVDCVRGNASSAARPNLRSSRLLVEMREIATSPHPKYDCYVSETDMSFWKIVMEGPDETPYSGSTFLLYLEMPENFPSSPPKGRFVTPIFHPNVNRHGRICHNIFDRDWTTDTSLRSVLDTVYGLLFQAETSDAVHTTVTLGYHHDQVGFAEEAREHAEKHAHKTREEWREELLDV